MTVHGVLTRILPAYRTAADQLTAGRRGLRHMAAGREPVDTRR